jgi:hypothetical protein
MQSPLSHTHTPEIPHLLKHISWAQQILIYFILFNKFLGIINHLTTKEHVQLLHTMESSWSLFLLWHLHHPKKLHACIHVHSIPYNIRQKARQTDKSLTQIGTYEVGWRQPSQGGSITSPHFASQLMNAPPYHLGSHEQIWWGYPRETTLPPTIHFPAGFKEWN